MGYEVTKAKVLSSLFWKLMERGGTQGIQFIVMILLARLLLPEEYGLIIIVSIFTAVSGVLVQGGFTTALIQKKNADEIDYSSVFYINLVAASILYILLFCFSPFIATFFNEPQLAAVLRILSLSLFLAAFCSIQNAVISRNMQFKKLFFSSLWAVLVSGTIGVILAFANYGVWALVAQSLTSQLLVIVFLWFTVNWRPKLLFSMERIIGLFSFGWKLLVSSLLDTLYINLQNLIVGKVFSPAMLGFYNRGQQFPFLLVSNVDGSIQSVILPTLSSFQDDKQRVKEIVRRSIVTSSFIIFPMMVGLAVIAEQLVKILLTEKWLPAVPFIQLFCAMYALWPIHTANLQVINALGRSDIFLKLEVVKKILVIVFLGAAIPFGIYAMVFAGCVSGIIAAYINAYPNKKLINYSFQNQLKDILPSLFLSFVMGAIVYSINWFGMHAVPTIIIQIIVGTLVYIGLANACKLESFTYLIVTLKEHVISRKSTQLKV